MAKTTRQKAGVTANVQGGTVQGVVGAQSVVIENLTFYGSPLPPQPSQEADAGAIPPCPYPGLAYFGPQDSALFFGRDTAIARLEAALAQRSLTALVGASGSGKSSVVLAGLAPRLNAKGGWRFSHFRVGTEPDKNPFLALARALAPLLGERSVVERLEEVQSLASKLASGAITMPNLVGACRSANPGKNVLLIADQFEEAFTLVPDEALRFRFIDCLLAGFPDQPAGTAAGASLMITLRADFYGVALRHRPFADALQGRIENLGPMTREELREAIVRPAGTVTFESGLVDTLLDDVASRPGGLPLLQFALREMWGRLEKRCMTRASYDAIGGIEGALAKRAQAVYEELTAKGENAHAALLFRRLFTRLVTLGEGIEDTRRVVQRDELGEEAWALAQRLAGEDNRLIVTSADVPQHETAEVVHEALIRHWPALIDWVGRDRAFQSWLRQLKPRVEEWEKAPQDEGTLLRGGPLAVAEEWLARRRDELSDQERKFIEASTTLREAAGRAEKARLAETAAQQERTARAQRRAQWTLAGMAVAVVAGIVGGIWQYQVNVASKRELAQARPNIFAEEATVEGMRRNYDSALRLAVHAAVVELGLSGDAKSPSLPHATLAATTMQTGWRLVLPHASGVRTAMFSPDGARIVTAADDKAVHIFDAATGKEIALLRRDEYLQFATLSPRGDRIVVPGKDSTAVVLEVPTGKEMAVLKGHESVVYSAAFTADGGRIVTASADGTARTWDAATGNPIGTLVGHVKEKGVLWAAFSPDGTRIVTASYDNTARIWDASTAQQLMVLKGRMTMTSAAFSPDGTRVVAGSWDKTAHIYDVATGNELKVLSGHDNWVTSVAYSRDGTRIVTASQDGTARVFDAATGSEVAVLRGHEAWLAFAAFSPDGSRVVTTSGDHTARIWDSAPGKEAMDLTGPGKSVAAAAFSADGARIVTASDDGTAGIWDARTGKEIMALKGHAGRLWSAAFSRDSARVVTASADKTARIWDAATGGEIASPLAHADAVLSAVFGTDGTRIMTISSDNIVHLWDVATGKQIRVWRGPTRGWGRRATPVHSAALSPDGTRVVLASWRIADRVARILDVATGEVIKELTGHEGGVHAVAFSRDGSRIATGSTDKTVRIWDATTFAEIRVLHGHEDTVWSVAFSADGAYLATGSFDKTVRIWDVATGREIAALPGHQDIVSTVAFSPDATRVVTTSGENIARIFDTSVATMSSKDLLAEACTRRLRGISTFTRDEMRLAGYSDSTPQIDVCAGI